MDIESLALAKKYANGKFNGFASNLVGSPKPYATLAALQSALPTGDTNVYLVIADGKLYYWSGSAWTAGNTYQATGLVQNLVPISRNIFNYANVVAGKEVYQSDGTFQVQANSAMTDYIPIPANNGYLYISGLPTYTTGFTNRASFFYDSNKTVIGSCINLIRSSSEFLVPIPANAAYYAFSIYQRSTDQGTVNYAAIQVELGYKTPYTSYQLGINAINGYSLQPYIDPWSRTNPLQGKVLLNFGDSIAAGEGAGGVNYASIIAAANGMVYKSYAVSGTVVSQIATSVVNATETSADYVLLEGGTNDDNNIANATENLGSLSSGYTATLDTSTFYGNVESMIKSAKTKWVGAKILYILVHNMSTRDATAQKTCHDAIIACCQKWSIPYVDLYSEGGYNSNIDVLKNQYGYGAEGTHPNLLGYQTYYVPPIQAKMKTL